MANWLENDEDPFHFVWDSSISTEKGLSRVMLPATTAEESERSMSDSQAHATFVDSREGARLARLHNKHVVQIIHIPENEEYDAEFDYEIYHPDTCVQHPNYYFNTEGDLVRAFRADCAEQHEVEAIGLDGLQPHQDSCIKFQHWQELPEGYYTFFEEGYSSYEYPMEYDGWLTLEGKVG